MKKRAKRVINRLGNVQSFIACDSGYDEAGIVIIGAGYDSTTSNRPGARFGPLAIRQDSYGLESYSPYLDKDLEGSRIYDAGDLELSFGDPVPVLGIIEGAIDEIMADGKLPLLIGGEHLVSLGAIRAMAKCYEDLHIIHFDAHTDLRDEYLGQRLSHATVMRRCYDILGDGRIFQFGIRSGSGLEFEWAKGRIGINKFGLDGLDEVIGLIGGAPVYFTLDMDVLDSSVFCGTGTPEAGGVSFMDLIFAIQKVSGLNIVGCDVVELAPNLDISGVSTATACKVVREMLLMLSK